MVKYLKAIAQKDTNSVEEKIALDATIKIITKSKNWDDCIKAIEILLKLLGIGSNFFK